MGLGQKSRVKLGLVEDRTGEVPVMPELSQETERGRAVLPFGAAEVTGPSMVPTLQHGDRLVVQWGARVRPGDVVVLRHPFQQDLLVVKRIAERREGAGGCSGTTRSPGATALITGPFPRNSSSGRCGSGTGP